MPDLTIDQVKEFLTANKENGDVKNFLNELVPKAPADSFNIDTIQEKINTDSAIKADLFKLFQPDVDSRISQAITTWKTNHLQEENNKAIKAYVDEHYPAEDERDKRIREIEQKMAANDAQRKRAETGQKAAIKCNELGLTLGENINLYLRDTPEETERLIALTREREKAAEERGYAKGRDEILKKGSHIPQSGNDNGSGVYKTKEEYAEAVLAGKEKWDNEAIEKLP